MLKTIKSILIGMLLMGCLVYVMPTAHAQSWVNLSGTVTLNGQPVCAMVLANGQYQFSCSPIGQYSLVMPPDSNYQITLFAFADGMLPFKRVLSANQGNFNIQMSVCSGGGGGGGTTTLRVRNQGSHTVWNLYISPTSSSNWGSDLLGNNSLPPGYHVDFTNIPCPANYDLRVRYSNGHIIDSFNNYFSCASTYTWTLYY